MHLSRIAKAAKFHSNLIANVFQEFLFFELHYIILFLLHLTANLKNYEIYKIGGYQNAYFLRTITV
jgi:hypothetical protein